MTRRNVLFLIPALLTLVGFTATCLTALSYRASPLSVWYHVYGWLALVYVLSWTMVFAFEIALRASPLGRTGANADDPSERLGQDRLSQLVSMPRLLSLQLLIGLIFISDIKHHVAQPEYVYIFLGLLPVFVGLEVLDLIGLLPRGRKARRVLNDELSSAHRAVALRTGFVVTLLGLAVAYFAELFQLDIAAYTLPMIMVAAVTSASLHFAWCEWRADG